MYLKKILGCIRRADQDFNLIEDGDKVAVGVSGGKDSMTLLEGLALYRRFSKKRYEMVAITVDPGHGFDPAPIEARCKELDVPFLFKPAGVVELAMEMAREGKNPCWICAKLRRGAFNNAAAKQDCNKVALAHHRDDVLETFVMSLLFEGRLNVFSPHSYMTKQKVTVIRPLVYLEEKYIKGAVRRLNIPVVKSICPFDGHTQRQETKELIAALCKKYKNADEMLFTALRNTDSYNLWDKAKAESRLPHDYNRSL